MVDPQGLIRIRIIPSTNTHVDHVTIGLLCYIHIIKSIQYVVKYVQRCECMEMLTNKIGPHAIFIYHGMYINGNLLCRSLNIEYNAPHL